MPKFDAGDVIWTCNLFSPKFKGFDKTNHYSINSYIVEGNMGDDYRLVDAVGYTFNVNVDSIFPTLIQCVNSFYLLLLSEELKNDVKK